MIEIHEIMPLYICGKEKECNVSVTCGGDECNHTTSPFEAANHEAVDIFNKFMDRFYVLIDDYGRLNVIERKKI
jgi:hypothetical protein